MKKEVLFASMISTVWIVMSFVVFGVCYFLLGEVVGHFKLMQLENAWGVLEYVPGLTIGRLALVELGLFMFLVSSNGLQRFGLFGDMEKLQAIAIGGAYLLPCCPL